MKLMLASDLSFLLKYGYNLTGIVKDQMRIGYVITASKGARDKTFIERIKNSIRVNRYTFEDIDIENELFNRHNEKLRAGFPCVIMNIILKLIRLIIKNGTKKSIFYKRSRSS